MIELSGTGSANANMTQRLLKGKLAEIVTSSQASTSNQQSCTTPVCPIFATHYTKERMTESMSASGPLEEEEGKARPESPERRDSISTVASFAFIPPTLPSYLARSISHDDGTDQQQHRLGLAEAVALVVGMQIGSGIFSSPGVIVHSTKSVGSSLVVWLVSGLLAWTGASSFAELGSAIPLNGGAQAYLAYAVSCRLVHATERLSCIFLDLV